MLHEQQQHALLDTELLVGEVHHMNVLIAMKYRWFMANFSWKKNLTHLQRFQSNHHLCEEVLLGIEGSYTCADDAWALQFSHEFPLKDLVVVLLSQILH